ncbi:hypothetical protein, partial [Bacteroides thetaiotaomicron]|uniref:hypothetical protein n=1 Tax=Bacteroides thetaiotaomicron TaxID=818 RepID=UPI001A925931
ATLLTRQDFNEFFFTHFLHSLFSGKDRDLKIQRQRVLYRGLTLIQTVIINPPFTVNAGSQFFLYY